jgi:hypothetical protein
MKDIPLSSSSVDEEGKKRGFWKPGESLNSNCNLPFERGEIVFTTNYLPMCLCIGVSHSLIGSDPPHEYFKDRRRLWTSRGVLVDIVIFWHVSIGSVQDDAPSECPRHHVWTSSWTRIFSFRFEILNLNKKDPRTNRFFLFLKKKITSKISWIKIFQNFKNKKRNSVCFLKQWGPRRPMFSYWKLVWWFTWIGVFSF